MLERVCGIALAHLRKRQGRGNGIGVNLNDAKRRSKGPR